MNAAIAVPLIGGIVVVSLAIIFVFCGPTCTSITYSPNNGTLGITRSSTITNYPPVINIQPTTGIFSIGEKIPFSAGKVTDPDGDKIESILWDFGDGKTGEGMSVLHSYDYKGEYTVVLVATDVNGNSAQGNSVLIIEDASTSTSSTPSTPSTPTIPSTTLSPMAPTTKSYIDYFSGEWKVTGYFEEGFDRIPYDGTMIFYNDGTFKESNSKGDVMFGTGTFSYSDQLTPKLTLKRELLDFNFFDVVKKLDNSFKLTLPFDNANLSFTRK